MIKSCFQFPNLSLVRLSVVLASFAPATASAQIRWGTFKDLKPRLVDLVPASLAAVSGGAHAFNQVITHHYDDFRRVYPNADHQFFDPSISWKNKYYGRDPLQGRTRLPVQFSDAMHLSSSISHTSMLGCGVSIGLQKPPSVLAVARSLLISFVCYSAVNDLVWARFDKSE